MKDVKYYKVDETISYFFVFVICLEQKMRLIGPKRSVSKPLMPHADLICLGCSRNSRSRKRKQKKIGIEKNVNVMTPTSLVVLFGNNFAVGLFALQS